MFPIDSENVTFDVWFILLGFQVKFCAKKKKKIISIATGLDALCITLRGFLTQKDQQI